VDVVDPMVAHHSAVGLRLTLRISRFQRSSRMDHRNRDDLVISKINATQGALGNRGGIGQRRPTESDDSEQTCGGILDGLLHILAKVTHPWWVGRPDRQAVLCSRQRVPGELPRHRWQIS
jgi:hypothetical protein